MARVEIRHKCIMVAREALRRDSALRLTGRSVFIKRYYGKYRLIGVMVSEKQRTCRNIFADAQKLASRDLSKWNRRRHWERAAKRHKVRGAHRMAVSWFYKLLKENDGRLDEALSEKMEGKMGIEERSGRDMKLLSINRRKRSKERMRGSGESGFLYKKFGDIEEYYDVAMRLAS